MLYQRGGITVIANAPIAKVSKNQRTFVKQEQKVFLCGKGHKLTNVMVDRQMERLCICDGYEPIDLKAPYQTRK